MNIYQLLPAPTHTATWLRNLLEPACTAARISNPRGLEIRPLGVFAGVSPGDKLGNSAGRLSISPRALLWRRPGLVSIYLHEQAHAFLEEVAPDVGHSHDAAFFCLNLALLRRLDAVDFLAAERASAWSDGMSLYDLQDPPPCWKNAAPEIWRPRAMAWAMEVAAELAPGELDATELASEVDARYWSQADAWAAEPAAQASAELAAQRRVARQVQLLSEAREQARQRGWLAIAGLGGLLATVVIALRFVVRS